MLTWLFLFVLASLGKKPEKSADDGVSQFVVAVLARAYRYKCTCADEGIMQLKP